MSGPVSDVSRKKHRRGSPCRRVGEHNHNSHAVHTFPHRVSGSAGICPAHAKATETIESTYGIAKISMLVVTRKYVTATINPPDFRQRGSSYRNLSLLPVHSRDVCSTGAEADVIRMNGSPVWLACVAISAWAHGMALAWHGMHDTLILHATCTYTDICP